MTGRIRLEPRSLVTTLWMAALLLAIALGYLAGVAFIPVGLAALILYTYPLLAGVIAAAAGREKLTPLRAAALAVAFGGLALALGAGFGTLDWRGIACVAVASVATAVVNCFAGAALRTADVPAAALYTNLWMLAALGAFMALLGGLALPTTTLGVIGVAGVCLCYVGAYLSWFTAARLISPVRLVALFNVEPVVTIAAAFVLLGERPGAAQIAGGLLVLGAVAVVTLSGRPRSPG